MRAVFLGMMIVISDAPGAQADALSMLRHGFDACVIKDGGRIHLGPHGDYKLIYGQSQEHGRYSISGDTVTVNFDVGATRIMEVTIDQDRVVHFKTIGGARANGTTWQSEDVPARLCPQH